MGKGRGEERGDHRTREVRMLGLESQYSFYLMSINNTRAHDETKGGLVKAKCSYSIGSLVQV